MERISAAGASSSRMLARLHNEEEEDEEEEEEEEEWSNAEGSESESENKSKCGEEPELPNASHQSNSDGSMTVSLTNPNVLDCDICYEPLSAPVFQCRNGHIACDQCCKKLKNKCPSCTLPIGPLRCRAVEKILESIRVSCPNTSYGCNETSMLYSQKQPHETKCIYSPCSCPFANCDYQSSAKKLALHFNKKHPDCLKYSFKYDHTLSIKLDTNVECIVVEEGDLFAITSYRNDFFWTAVFVSRIIGKTVLQQRHPYTLNVRIEEHEGISYLSIQSFTTNHVPCKSSKFTSTPPAGKFLMIPKDSFDGASSELRQIRLALCIHPSV